MEGKWAYFYAAGEETVIFFKLHGKGNDTFFSSHRGKSGIFCASMVSFVLLSGMGIGYPMALKSGMVFLLKCSLDRKLAIRWHPDKNAGNEEAKDMFQQINNAYEHLCTEHGIICSFYAHEDWLYAVRSGLAAVVGFEWRCLHTFLQRCMAMLDYC